MNSPKVAQLSIGRPENHAHAGETPWITAIYRKPVNAPVFCTTMGFDGDAVADRRFHGGPEKAVLCYSIAHYPKWQQEGLPAGPGGFGENLTIDEQDEWSVCIGDTFRIGEAEVQVSQPRGPCGTLARRWERPDLVKLVKENHRSGWYIRILREGKIGPGEAVELVSRPNPDWTIARTAEVNYSRKRTVEELRELVGLPELSTAWKSDLGKKLQAMAAR